MHYVYIIESVHARDQFAPFFVLFVVPYFDLGYSFDRGAIRNNLSP